MTRHSDRVAFSLSDVDLECPDCTTSIDVPVSDGGRRTTAEGDVVDSTSGVDPTADELGLRGIDVKCDCCGTELGVYTLQ
jgi:ribosomal protein S27E